jgi:hypothetical protein
MNTVGGGNDCFSALQGFASKLGIPKARDTKNISRADGAHAKGHNDR